MAAEKLTHTARAERDAAIEASYRGGQTIARLASAYGLTSQRVHQILRGRGVPTRGRGTRARTGAT